MRFQPIQHADRSRVQPATAGAVHHLSKSMQQALLISLLEVEDSVPLFRAVKSCPNIPIQARSTHGSRSSCALRQTKQTADPAIPPSSRSFPGAITKRPPRPVPSRRRDSILANDLLF